MAHAVPVCQYISSELIRGHANTYVAAVANPAVGDYIGTMQQLRVTVECHFDYVGDNSWYNPSWHVITRPTPNLYHANLSVYFADGSEGSYKPVLTTTELESIGLGFVGLAGLLSFSPGNYISESFVPHNGYGKALYHSYDGGGWTFYVDSVSLQYSTRLSNHNHVRFNHRIYYRLVKINENFNALSETASTYSIAPFIMGNLAFRQVGFWSYTHYGTSNTISVPSPTQTLTFAQRTCATPYVEDGVVKLPMINQNNLPVVGSGGPWVEFNLKVDCPAHLGYIGYYVQPVHGVADGLESQGVININPASSAKGIGLQIETRSAPKWPDFARVQTNYKSSYRPIQFGPTNRYGWSTGYSQFGPDPNSNPLADRITVQTPPLRVRVYRTGTVVPGTFNAAIWVHMVYR